MGGNSSKQKLNKEIEINESKCTSVEKWISLIEGMEKKAQEEPNQKENENKVINGYELICELGKGGFGSVYKVRKVETGEIFAMKEMQANEIDINHIKQMMFVNEAGYSSYIKDKDIGKVGENEQKVYAECADRFLHIHRIFRTPSNYYIVMEYCDGGSLRQLLNNSENKRLPEPIAFECMEQLYYGFVYLHCYLILHNDIKPDNIFIHGNKLKIGDFGLAQDYASPNLTLCGTIYTLSPERLSINY